MTYSQKNPIAFNEKPASSVKMNEEFVQIYGALNEIDGLKAPLESPALTGNPTAPTQTASDNSTKIATTAFVKDVVADYAPLESPALTGSPTAPTQAADDDSTKIATTAYVKDQVASDTVAGMVELATPAEVLSGEDTERAVTPAGFLAGLRGNLLGTVSQSDGVPTGAVIERGSNANGEYVKFADGTMICTGSTTFNSVSGTEFAILFYVQLSKSFPATFTAAPSVTSDPGFLASYTLWSAVPTPTTTGFSMYMFSQKAFSSINVNVRFIAIGRWF